MECSKVLPAEPKAVKKQAKTVKDRKAARQAKAEEDSKAADESTRLEAVKEAGWQRVLAAGADPAAQLSGLLEALQTEPWASSVARQPT